METEFFPITPRRLRRNQKTLGGVKKKNSKDTKNKRSVKSPKEK